MKEHFVSKTFFYTVGHFLRIYASRVKKVMSIFKAFEYGP